MPDLKATRIGCRLRLAEGALGCVWIEGFSGAKALAQIRDEGLLRRHAMTPCICAKLPSIRFFRLDLEPSSKKRPPPERAIAPHHRGIAP
ncbi:MAG: hypothetical protein ISN28_09905 [Ectothiorhodospiraceae bacterium AqS1]|nr:hypothetical protein [Ectothiorhodospiraceae bacterium AqS1]